MVAAAFSKSPEIVTLLLEKGAEIEARDERGMTPLMHAARSSKTPEIVTLLLGKGADPLAKDREGKKAIYYAKLNDQLKGTPAFQELKKASKGWWPFG